MLAKAILGLGLAQVVLVVLALARILDPGWSTFIPVGVMAGLGMAGIGLVAALHMPWKRPSLARVGWLAVVAGLLTTVVWASVFGGTLYTDDLVRVSVIVVSDVLFAVALASSTRLTSGHGVLEGSGPMATVLSVRAIVEIWALFLILTQANGPGPNVAVIVVAIAVLVGWVALAAWEIYLGARLIRSPAPTTAAFHPPGG